MLEEVVAEHQAVISDLLTRNQEIQEIFLSLEKCIFRRNGKLLLCGNGGSAADCQHIAAELVGRFRREREPIPAIALTTDTSVLTAVGNDYGYDEIFRRQILALMQPQDVLLCFSTSGNSENVVRAAFAARFGVGARVIAFTGAADSRLSEQAHQTFRVASTNTARIQECHILLGHILCEMLEREL